MTREKLVACSARVCRAAVLASIVCSPTQWGMTVAGGVHISAADPLIALAALAWVARTLLDRDAAAWRRLPWQVPAFVLPAVLSICVAGRLAPALRDALKIVEYFVLGYLVYDDWLWRDRCSARTATRLLAGMGIVIVLMAAVQYATAADPLRVRGTFGNRNVLAGWLSMVLPVLFGVALYGGSLPLRVGLLVVVALGFAVDLSAASAAAVGVAVLMLAAARGWRAYVPAALAVVVWFGVVTPRIGWFRDAQTGEPLTHQMILFRSAASYAPDGQPERRYPEWQSAVEMMLTHPWLGEGIGNYQRSVGLYTGSKPRFTGPSEPDIQNLYLVIGASMGLPALLGFLALLGAHALRAAAAVPRLEGWEKGLAGGVAGGIAAFAVTAAWHPLLVRGIGLHLVLLLVLARTLAARSANALPGNHCLPCQTPVRGDA